MTKALIGVVLFGVLIGLVWPSDRPVPDQAVAAAPNLTPQSQPQPFASGPPPETRLKRQDNGHFYVHAEVNGQLVQFIVDTGATGVALTVEDAQRVGIPFSPAEFTPVGRGASGEVRGKRVSLASVSVEGKTERDVSGVVLEGSDISLLGQSYLGRLNSVHMSGDTMTLR